MMKDLTASPRLDFNEANALRLFKFEYVVDPQYYNVEDNGCKDQATGVL